MKFTDGFWALRDGVTATLRRRDLRARRHAPLAEPARDRKAHRDQGRHAQHGHPHGRHRLPIRGHRARPRHPPRWRRRLTGVSTSLARHDSACATTASGNGTATLTTGALEVRVAKGAPFAIEFLWEGRRLTGLGHKALAHMALADHAPVSADPVGDRGLQRGRRSAARRVHGGPAGPRRWRDHLRPRRALWAVRQERPDRRHLERRRRHQLGAGVQVHSLLPVAPRATACWSTPRSRVV